MLQPTVIQQYHITRADGKCMQTVEGVEMVYEMPPRPKAVLLLFHGCQHSCTDWWPASEACTACKGASRACQTVAPKCAWFNNPHLQSHPLMNGWLMTPACCLAQLVVYVLTLSLHASCSFLLDRTWDVRHCIASWLLKLCQCLAESQCCTVTVPKNITSCTANQLCQASISKLVPSDKPQLAASPAANNYNIS